MKTVSFRIGSAVLFSASRAAWLCAGMAVCAVLQVCGVPLSEREALARLAVWMRDHPVMGVAAGRQVKSVESFSADGTAYHLYVVSFAPCGYAVLNSDDRLPLAVAFSASSKVSLADRPDNSFRAVLLAQSGLTGQKLASLGPADEPVVNYLSTAKEGKQSVEQYGPYLETLWDQCYPYNLDCPDTTNAMVGYNGRVPTGCAPTAYAQVLRYHRWPLYGHGSHSYTDAAGSVTGTHSVVFSNQLDWDIMQIAYDPWVVSGQEGDTAVADLMYRLGVAAEADYESGGTSSSIQTLGERINTYLYFEQPVYANNQAALLPDLQEDLTNGYPAVVAIPGHAIVADGLLDYFGDISYHLNYGWGGYNNGWYAAGDVNGSALAYGCTSIRPKLMAFPRDMVVNAIDDEPVELEWILPFKREAEAASLLIKRLSPQSGAWSSAADDLEHAVVNGWSVQSGGRNGDCWYTGPNGVTSLTLTDEFIPASDTTLNFWIKFMLGSATFTVAVSADGGETFTTLFETNNNPVASWHYVQTGLGTYTGQRVLIRFALGNGSYYAGGGVWLDDLSLSSGAWSRWTDFAQDSTLAAYRFSEQRTLLDECADFSVFELTTQDPVYTQDWTVDAAGGVSSCFFKAVPEYTGGKYHLTSRSPVTPTSATRLLFSWQRLLYTDMFRVLISSDRSNFTEVWSAAAFSDWTEQAIPLGAYAGQPIYIRLEYVGGGYYDGGGVWIDKVWLQEAQLPEIEYQPVHYTELEPLAAGSYTLAAAVADTNGAWHALGPAFTLTVQPRYTYREEGDGSVTITSYVADGVRLALPSELDGMTVSGIATGAVSSAALESVLIPGTVTNIEAGAFAGTDLLERVFFAGDAPTAPGTLFDGMSLTVYYLPGAYGWGATFGGRPTVLWNPAIQSGATFGFSAGSFGFQVSGTAGIPVLIEAVDNLSTGIWDAVIDTALDGSGFLNFSDTASAGAPARFYRINFP